MTVMWQNYEYTTSCESEEILTIYRKTGYFPEKESGHNVSFIFGCHKKMDSVCIFPRLWSDLSNSKKEQIIKVVHILSQHFPHNVFIFKTLLFFLSDLLFFYLFKLFQFHFWHFSFSLMKIRNRVVCFCYFVVVHIVFINFYFI